MPTRPPTARSPYNSTPTAKAAKEITEIDRLYNRSAWRKCKAAHLALNPICQRVENGYQCQNAASVVHHLVSPYKNLNQFYDWQNLVALCAEHHETSEGENLTAPHTYALTNGLLGATCDANKRIAELRGDASTAGTPERLVVGANGTIKR